MSLPEDVMLGAVVFGHEQMQVAIKAINELKAEAGKPAWNWQPAAGERGARSGARRAGRSCARRRLQGHREAGAPRAHSARSKTAACSRWPAAKRRSSTPTTSRRNSRNLEYRIVRRRILAGEPRIDGRDTKTVRPITIRTGVLPRTHGSALFTRGETQALVVDDARHRPRRADHRCARRRAQRAVHASLQLPAVQRRRDRHDGLAEAPRNRPRQPGAPRHRGRDAGHDARSRTSSASSRKFSSRTARARWRASAARASR